MQRRTLTKTNSNINESNGEKALKSILHFFPREFPRVALLLDTGTSKDAVLQIIKNHLSGHGIQDDFEEAIEFYVSEPEKAKEIVLPYTTGTDQWNW